MLSNSFPLSGEKGAGDVISPKREKMKGGGCGDDLEIIDARLHKEALPASFFEQPAKQQLLGSNLLPIQTVEAGNCCFEAINRTVYGDSSFDRICKTRRNMCAYIQSNYDVFQEKLVRSIDDPVDRESLLAQHGRIAERVTAEFYGDMNTIIIFAAMESIKFLVLKIQEGCSECVGRDDASGVRHVLIFDSKIPHYLATAARTDAVQVLDPEPLFFANPFCDSTGFLDSFSETENLRYHNKRDVLCVFHTVEQLYQFIMAELYTDWRRADEILAAEKPAEAVSLGKRIRIQAVDTCTGEVYTVRNAYNTPEWWSHAPGAMLEALKSKFCGNELLSNRLLETSPRPLARAAQYDRRWGIGCRLEYAQWGMEWNGSNWLGRALVEVRDIIEHERMSTKYSGNLSRGQLTLVTPSTTELCVSSLAAVGNVTQLRDGDIHVAAQLFVGESNVQQAALFGMDESGSILKPENIGAPLKRVKEMMQANTGVTFLGEKRSRPQDGLHLIQAKKSNGFVKEAGLIGKIPCLTCVSSRDDDCKVCNVCCACCTCVPKKQFDKCAHFYATDKVAESGVVPTQYTECEHGFVLVQGTVDATIKPQCTRPECVNSAVVPPEAAAFAATVQQPDAPVVPSLNTTAAAAGEGPSGVLEELTFADDEPFYDAPGNDSDPKSNEPHATGTDWVRENLCEGCDCEFNTRQQLDAHCCSQNNYTDSDSSDSKPTVPVIVPVSGAQPMLDVGDLPAESMPVNLSVDATDVAVTAIGTGADPKSEPLPMAVDDGGAANDSVMAFVKFSDPVHKVAKCVNCDGTFANIGVLVEHHKECLIGSRVACYAGTTTPVTMLCPDPVDITCMVCKVVVNLHSVSTYKLGPKIFCSSLCQARCQHKSEVVLRDFQRTEALDAEEARQAGVAAHLLSSRQLEKARLRIVELEAMLAARGVIQRTLEERLARIQSSHSSDDRSGSDDPRLYLVNRCFYGMLSSY
jgi:ribA/ribD-fused uncharacterized protein